MTAHQPDAWCTCADCTTVRRVLRDRVPAVPTTQAPIVAPPSSDERATFARWFRESFGYIAFSSSHADGRARCNGAEAECAWAAWQARSKL